MMDRYQQTFKRLKQEPRPAFCPFAVLGHPNKKEFLERIQYYLQEGADVLELGIPFSDPVADGPTIQAADELTLKNGIRVKDCLELIRKVRTKSQIPIGILTYANIVYQYGIEAFYRDLHRAGADSILIADVPLEEISPFLKAGRSNNIHQIMMVSENTSLERLILLEKIGNGFFYVVSTMGVTGARRSFQEEFESLLKKLQNNSSLPLMVGFGISTDKQIYDLRKMKVDGIIIGSALIKTSTKKLSSTLSHFRNAFYEKNTI